MRTALSPGQFGAWSENLTVEVEKVDPLGSCASTYSVFADGRHVGFVASRRDGRRTEWGHVATRDERLVAGAPDRRTAVANLLSSRDPVMAAFVEQFEKAARQQFHKPTQDGRDFLARVDAEASRYMQNLTRFREERG